jgi:hypothetical protein
MFDTLLGWILFLSVTFQWRVDNPYKMELMFFQTAVSILFIISIWCKRRRELSNEAKVFCTVLLSLTLAGVALNGFASVSMMAWLILLLCSLFGMLVYQYCEKPKKVMWFVTAGAIVNIAVMLLQRYGGIDVLTPTIGDIKMPVPGEYGGLIGSSPRLGMLLTMIFPLCSWPVAAVFAGVCLWIKELTVLAVVSLILFFKSDRWWKKLIIAVISAAGVYFLRGYIIQALGARWVSWKPALIVILNNPKGFGVGLFPSVFSSVLQTIYMMGLAGIAFYVYIFQRLSKNFKPTAEVLAVIALLSLMVFEYVLETIRLWPVIITVVAFYFIKQKEVENAA